MKKELKVGDLVRDKLNKGENGYGIGVVLDGHYPRGKENDHGKKYAVYFTKFRKTITFHGDYLERISKD